jgi:hypothetical protein
VSCIDKCVKTGVEDSIAEVMVIPEVRKGKRWIRGFNWANPLLLTVCQSVVIEEG